MLDGRRVRDEIVARLRTTVERFPSPPVLAIIEVGNREDAQVYIRQKRLLGETIGVGVRCLALPAGVSARRLTTQIEACNRDETVHGVVVQLPLPKGLDWRRVVATIDPEKDVDGLTPENRQRLSRGDLTAFLPATARGMLTLLDYYGIGLAGRRAAVVGRSFLVGAPLTDALRARGAAVTVCHSQTSNTKEITRASDIVVVAMGRPRFITREYLREGQVVIDMGINVVGDPALNGEPPRRRVVGDVDFGGVKNLVSAITPVPGGVGPMTIVSLFQNLVSAYERQKNRHHT